VVAGLPLRHAATAQAGAWLSGFTKPDDSRAQDDLFG
jgi:hypothetical protein